MTAPADVSALFADTSPDNLLTGGCQRQLTPIYGTPLADTPLLTPQGRSAVSRCLDADLLTGRHLLRARERSAGDWRRRSCAHRVPTDRVPAGQRPVVGLVIRGSGRSVVTASVGVGS